MGYISSETLISYCALLVQAFNKNGSIYLKFRCPRVISVFFLTYFQQDATLHTLFISGKILYIFRLVSPPIIRSTHNCIYSIWYLSNRYCYLLLLCKSWNFIDLFWCGCNSTKTDQYNSHATLKPVPTLPQ